jgi:hypothetical protein
MDVVRLRAERTRHRSPLAVEHIGKHDRRSLVDERSSLRLPLTAGRPRDERHLSL